MVMTGVLINRRNHPVGLHQDRTDSGGCGDFLHAIKGLAEEEGDWNRHKDDAFGSGQRMRRAGNLGGILGLFGVSLLGQWN